MKRNKLTIIILGLLLTSSCSLLDQFKTPEEGTVTADSEVTPDIAPEAEMAAAEENIVAPANSDDELYSRTLSEFAEPTNAPAKVAPIPETYADTQTTTTPAEVMPEIKHDVAVETHSQNIKFYKVKKGETLMQIAFKIYGDISRWKDLKNLNQEKVSRNSALSANLTLKYEAPEAEFVWNPVGSPYMIRNGETLGIISNNIYQTPKKWKNIWENNKPLIKNPNVIYAGFTLYYRDEGLANYVQPKKHNKVVKTQPVMDTANAPIEKVEVANELLQRDVADKAEQSAAMEAPVEEATTVQ